MTKQPWPEPTDDDRVEKLIGAIQGVVASAYGAPRSLGGTIEVDAPDLANALLVVLASVLEGSPAAATPAGMRQLAETAGKELHALMRDARDLRSDDGSAH